MAFKPDPLFKWSRKAGYEVSSIGDRKYSAFYANIDGRSIEEIYQCDVKGYASAKEGKGKPPLHGMGHDYTWQAYLSLWQIWALEHEDDMYELAILASADDYTLRDTFASTPVNQARALSYILNQMFDS